MKSFKLCICTLLTATAYATEYTPWFQPPFEFQGRLGYWHTHANTVTSPLGNFHSPTRNASCHAGVGVTPWPYWNVEAELRLTKTHDTSLNYEAVLLTGRYAWLDDIAGDPFTLVSGLTLSVPGSHFLHEFSFPYHGHVNLEYHTTIGKEWSRCTEWRTRAWALVGIGTAEKGNPWIHGLATVSYRPLTQLSVSVFSEALYGLGHRNIVPLSSFPGYASIRHQNIDLGASVDYYWRYLGKLTFLGWHTLHARNFIDHAWGVSFTLLVPFSIL